MNPPEKTRFLLYIVPVIMICLPILYTVYTRKNTLLQLTTDSSMICKSSLNVMCHAHNGSSFRRNALKQLIITTTSNRSAYVNESDAKTVTFISQNYSDLSEFIKNTQAALKLRRLVSGIHSIQIIFHNPPFKDMVRPYCDGLWMEFGVFRGATLTQIANWKKTFCNNTNQPVYGFDTFTGLPTNWRPTYNTGAFSIPNGTVISVPSNVVLVKGLFIDTLPTQLRLIDQIFKCHTPVSFIHIDCDVYEGARDVLFLLGSRLVSGSILVFDELFNYPGYEKHEIKALFELLAGSNLRLIPLGSSTEIEFNPIRDLPMQSFAFVVA
jgi:hypothetical protein